MGVKSNILSGSCLIFSGLVACAYHPDDFKRPVDESTQQSFSAAPPAPPIPEGEALYQMLYADEFGDEARAMGQRARMLAWLNQTNLDSTQLEALIPLAQRVRQAVEDDEAERMALGPKELAAYRSTYESLIKAFVGQGSLSAEDLSRHASDLREARTRLWGETNPHKARYKRVAKVLADTQVWVNGLSDEQKNNLAKVRFFLRRQLSPLSRPGHYESMLSGSWDVGDFDTLRYAGRSPNEAALDIGGLWSAEAYRVRPGTHLTALQVQALVARATMEPGLVEAIEVVLGRREPLNFD